MRELSCELLKRELGWAVAEVAPSEMLVDAIERERPDLIVVDAGDFPACCQAAFERFPRDRVIVIGPEPDDGYRTLALAEGAGSWVARECVGEELVAQLRALLVPGAPHQRARGTTSVSRTPIGPPGPASVGPAPGTVPRGATAGAT
ncbi:MAG: hypothetical protein IVW52_17170 [Acidimicrobiales bacterium]|nr:hypothetical protein [Acidimicrobiales bacterium]